MKPQFMTIKRAFFPRWDRRNLWRVSTRSRRKVEGCCDPKRRVIEIVVQHGGPDQRDRLLIHEISHAVAGGGHGTKWQDRMERAARRADELGRNRLAKMLRDEIADYRESWKPVDEAYGIVQEWLTCNPGLTLPQVRRALADQYGLLVSEVAKTFQRFEKVFTEAKWEALEARAMKEAWLKGGSRVTSVTTTPKHGVHIRGHKNWNTKTVYNNGHVMRIYRRQPKVIRFQSPMVNDFNQHLCGGWSMKEINDEKEATLQQLLAGRKPLACICFWPDRHADAVEAQDRLVAAGLVTDLRRRDMQSYYFDHIWDLTGCHDMQVKDIGDLKALRDDYAQVFDLELEEAEVIPFADHKLYTFFDEWDSPPLPLRLTGLILGYPVENTISLYLE